MSLPINHKENNEKLSPMYEQYLDIKKDYPDAFLFYRMGDFYELFFEDAVQVAKLLQLTLTSRNKDSGIPMAGVPHHALDGYIETLIDQGHSLVICDQVENPKYAKGLVKRAVTRVITPGTVLETNNLSSKEHHFLGAYFFNSQTKITAFAWLDMTTGDWTGFESNKENEIIQWVLKIAPKELLLVDSMPAPSFLQMAESIRKTFLPLRSHFDKNKALDNLKRVQKVQDAASLGVDDKEELLRCLGALVTYLEQTQKQDINYLKPFQPLQLKKYLILDEITEKNLELFIRTDGKKGQGTLFSALDATLTAAGARMLFQRLKQPFGEKEQIEKQQDLTTFFASNQNIRSSLRLVLDYVHDLERISTKLHLNRAIPRDCIALKTSLKALPKIYSALYTLPYSKEIQYHTTEEKEGRHFPEILFKLMKNWDNMEDVATILEKAFLEEPAQALTEGGIFKKGFDPELDSLLQLIEHAEEVMEKKLLHEQEKCKLPKLKLGFNRVFGYYYELSKGAIPSELPPHFQIKQTLATAERYATSDLKETENAILSASEKRNELEYQLFNKIREYLCEIRSRLIYMADIIGVLDCAQSLAEVACKLQWVKPVIENNNHLLIKEGRHPVVEQLIGKSNFVPNSLSFDNEKRLLLITGPNMAGKSTIIRQTALIVLLAHIGAYVPAQKAHIGLTDRIFSRVGASDNLAKGQSTFMVEMMETARILRQYSKKSLIILDEIGRGTSTYDGLSLAWSIAEELTKANAPRTLFATHYHELTALDGNRSGIYTMNIAIREWQNEIIFLRKLIPGPSDKSYGIDVAKLAGIPLPVVQRAKAILTYLEQNKVDNKTLTAPLLEQGFLPFLDLEIPKNPKKNIEFTMPEIKEQNHPLTEILNQLIPEELSPMQALKLIHEWKILWGRNEEKNHEN